jgi:hypothetical protein
MIALVSKNAKLFTLLLLIGSIIALSHFRGETLPNKRGEL